MLRRPAERREVALRLVAEQGFSQRRACALAEVDPKTVRREPVPDSPEIRARLRSLAGEPRRFGFRRLGIRLEREGIVMNKKKLFRLYSDEGLSGPPTTRPQACNRHPGTDGNPARTEPALVAGRRPSCSNRWRLEGNSLTCSPGAVA